MQRKDVGRQLNKDLEREKSQNIGVNVLVIYNHQRAEREL